MGGSASGLARRLNLCDSWAMLESPRMSSQEFAIAYDGPALANHTMDVQSLGPALLAIGDLCQEANRVINGQNVADVNVRVKATGEGCFDILFELVHKLYDDAADLVREDEVATAKELLEWLGLGAAPLLGLVGFLKWKRGRKIVKQEASVDGRGNSVINVTVEGSDNTITVISPSVHELATDPRVRAAQRRMLAPLSESGVEEFRVRHKRKTVTRILKDDLEKGYFDLDPDEFGGEEPANDPQTFEAVLVLRAPVFVEDSKWQFFYGGQRISATLDDPNFVRSVFKGGARFGVGDRFRVRLRLSQMILSNGKIRNDYEILKVIETTPGPKQLDMGLNGIRPAEDPQ